MGSQSAYEEVTRSMTVGLEKSFNDFKSEMRSEFKASNARQEQMFNHLSNRLPAWGTVLISVLTALLAGFVGLGLGATGSV